MVVGGLLPLAVLALDGVTGALGANPIQQALQQSGLLALTLLVLSLACTPLRKVTGWTWPARIRRALGLLAFGYAGLHFVIYALDHGLSLGTLVSNVVERPFITVGFAAFVLLVPLAVTSTPQWVRQLGFVRWQQLHRLVYVAAGLAAVHFFWSVKKDHTEPVIYGAVLLGLLASRRLFSKRTRTARPAQPSGD